MRSISREKAVQHILASKGRIFSVEWLTQKTSKRRKMTGRFVPPTRTRQNQDKIFGYVTIRSVDGKQIRRVDTRSISQLNINKQKLTVR